MLPRQEREPEAEYRGGPAGPQERAGDAVTERVGDPFDPARLPLHRCQRGELGDLPGHSETVDDGRFPFGQLHQLQEGGRGSDRRGDEQPRKAAAGLAPHLDGRGGQQDSRVAGQGQPNGSRCVAGRVSHKAQEPP